LADKSDSSIGRYVNGRVKGAAQMTLKMAEINTTTGLKTVALLTEKQILEVISKYKPVLSLSLYLNNMIKVQWIL
jgi:hypothetical protein